MFERLRDISFDIIYFNTIADNFIHYADGIRKLDRNNIFMTLHDINGFFHYTPSLSIRRFIRFFGKQKLIALIPSFNVLSETLIPHLKEKVSSTKKIFNIPGSFFEPEKFTRIQYQKNEPLRITVAGSIDTRRRDYSLVFDLLNIANAQKINISVTLLGGFSKKYSGQIYSQCLQYIQSNNDLHIYETEIVSQQEFNRVMNDTHFIWMPLQPAAIVTDGTIEQYGTSISSGNTGDVIRYVRPFFAPAHFNIDSALQKSRCTYSSVTGIINVLKNLDSAEYDRLQNAAFNASMNYTKEKIIAKNPELFG
jgi:hypothetical protein